MSFRNLPAVHANSVIQYSDMKTTSALSNVAQYYHSLFAGKNILMLCQQISAEEAKRIDKNILIQALAQLCCTHPDTILVNSLLEKRIIDHAKYLSVDCVDVRSERTRFEVSDTQIIVEYDMLHTDAEKLIQAYNKRYPSIVEKVKDPDSNRSEEKLRYRDYSVSLSFNKVIFCQHVLKFLKNTFIPIANLDPEIIQFAERIGWHFKITAEFMLKSELLETAIIQHAHMLNPHCSIPLDIDLYSEASWHPVFEKIPVSESAAIFSRPLLLPFDDVKLRNNCLMIHFKSLSSDQIKELVQIYNSHYPFVAKSNHEIRKIYAGNGGLCRFSVPQGIYFYKNEFLEYVLKNLVKPDMQNRKRYQPKPLQSPVPFAHDHKEDKGNTSDIKDNKQNHCSPCRIL